MTILELHQFDIVILIFFKHIELESFFILKIKNFN